MTMENRPKKLLEQVSDQIRLKHYSYRTEETYIQWIRRYILFHNKRHPKEMGVPEIEAFLSHLAVEGNVSASTQNQALSALLFLYKHVLKQELGDRVDAIRAKRPTYLPTVLTPEEVRSILTHMSGIHRLLIQILYGSGLRQTECLQLRVKDLDFQQSQIMVRSGKGGKDRITPMPKKSIANGAGNLHSPPATSKKIQARPFPIVIHFTKAGYKNPLNKPCDRQPLQSASVATPSPPTSSKAATTSALFKNSSVTATSKPP